MKKRHPMDQTEVHSIGTILLRMKAITRAELTQVVREQEEMSADQLLGELLINRGFIDAAQLKVALDAQDGLRSRRPHVRAMAAARLAELSTQKVVHLAVVTQEESRTTRRSVTKEDHPAVTPEMMAAKSGEE